MTKNRLEAFSDGVVAILITIMVLELKVPHGATLDALQPLLPIFGSYVMSFIYLGIYWNNHHHLIHAVKFVNGKVLWANMNLLFWLSLIPFVTAWMGENHFSEVPVSLYGLALLMPAIAYYILTITLISSHPDNHSLADAVGKDVKGILSAILYALAIPLAFVHPMISMSIYIIVALIWLVPDKRIERLEKK
jgi:uncharacterized membrane protein